MAVKSLIFTIFVETDDTSWKNHRKPQRNYLLHKHLPLK